MQCKDFVGLVPGENGELEVLASPNLNQHKFAILGDAHGNFSQFLCDRKPLWIREHFQCLLQSPKPDMARQFQRNRPKGVHYPRPKTGNRNQCTKWFDILFCPASLKAISVKNVKCRTSAQL